MTQIALVALFMVHASACRDASTSSPDDDIIIANDVAPAIELPIIGVEQLASELSTGGCTVFDVNTTPVRKRHGAIPGAILLDHYERYSLSELPADTTRPLVFYCANRRCSASDIAARRAVTAGYLNVRVLRDGISGWRKRGQSVQSIADSP